MPRLLLAALLVLLALPARAQEPAALVPPEAPVALTLDEALQIALDRNYAVRLAALDVAAASAQVREAWGQVLPSVDANASYTRNLVQANPFAGSDAGGLFGALGSIDWLAFNERARTDGDPATEPISLGEFRQRQGEGFQQAGISVGPNENPFGVPNQFQTGLSVTQTLYNGSAFAAIKGARSLREINEAALTQQEQGLVHRVRQLYYGALLAERQAGVARASVGRTQATADETARRVSAGTLPKFERLTAEVEVANLETQLLTAENQAALARDQLLFTLGLPVGRPIALRGDLDVPTNALVETVSFEDAVAVALERRPELEQARLAVKLREVDRNIARSGYFPTVNAFANLAYLGNVPDNRDVVTQGADPSDPFGVTVEERGFFDDAYWNPSVAVGAQLQWNLFDGFQTTRRVQQRQIAIEQAEVQFEQAAQSVVLEVEAALRNLASSRQRIAAQGENVGRAETAYAFAETRLEGGVSTQIDVRLASQQLDQARLGYLQAVYDYLTARSDLQRAVGVVLPEPIGDARISLTSAE